VTDGLREENDSTRPSWSVTGALEKYEKASRQLDSHVGLD